MTEQVNTFRRSAAACETWEHIHEVQKSLVAAANIILSRALHHDTTKLMEPEAEAFEKVTAKLKDLTYGSAEYKASLKELGPALEHHYAENRHHPEFSEKGIDGMTLIDILEMYCDWRAATKRHSDGNLDRSITVNKERFRMSDQLEAIFRNTMEIL